MLGHLLSHLLIQYSCSCGLVLLYFFLLFNFVGLSVVQAGALFFFSQVFILEMHLLKAIHIPKSQLLWLTLYEI